MVGFCPDDWHGTTEEDLQERSWGEDYHYWADVHASLNLIDRRMLLAQYAVHNEAIAQAEREGLKLHLLSDVEQNARMDAAEHSLSLRNLADQPIEGKAP